MPHNHEPVPTARALTTFDSRRQRASETTERHPCGSAEDGTNHPSRYRLAVCRVGEAYYVHPQRGIGPTPPAELTSRRSCG